MAVDYMQASVQALLPQHLTSNAYMQSGGSAGGYLPWVESQLYKTAQQTPYSTYDPRFFQGQENFDNVTGRGPQIQRNDRGEPTNIPGAILPSQVQAQQEQINQTMGNQSPNTTPASAGASAALAGGARSLQNRKPGLAGGFSGWSGGADQSGGSSNFNYFSRFA